MKLGLSLAGLCSLLAACGSKPLDTGSPPAAHVWTETSSSLEVSCFGFFQGSMRFVARRDQLSASQLAMLSQMTLVDGDPTCFSDGMGCSLTVVDAGGGSTTFDAVESDAVCTNPHKVVAYDAFNPFRLGLGCQYAKDLTYAQPPYVPVTPDPRCYNGLFTGGDESGITVSLGVDDVTVSHRIELDDCVQAGRVGKLSFTVIGTDGVTILGSSAAPADPGPDGTCAALDLAFPYSGGYALQVEVAAGTLPGDFFLRFY